MELVAPGWSEYAVLDSGTGLRLERLGEIWIIRQCAQAFWPKTLPESEWQRAHATHFRHDVGPGTWTYHHRVPDHWLIRRDSLAFEMRLTEFGHIGIFAEQETQWSWITETLRVRDAQKALNLFAYTGGSTLAAAHAGAHVTHVDAVKGVVNWASSNAAASGLGQAPIRWIVDDAVKFTGREVRRGARYDAVILDPPTFGRSATGSVWKIEDNVVALLEDCERLLTDEPAFVLLSAHTPGVTAATLRNLLAGLVARRGGTLQSGEMVQQPQPPHTWAPLPDQAVPNLIPSGVYCRWVP